MQSITLIVLGKLNASYFREAAAEYQKRLSAFCKLNIVELPEETIREKNVSQSTIQKTLEKEAQEILRHVVRPGVLVAMCIEGKQLSSEELSVFLEQRAISGEGSVTFVIGSSHGLADAVKKLADYRFSMSKMTFPHQLARVMLLEQIYRAFCIQSGNKYHK
ncbi:23S rRNA (pseudouridine(1915)-N(3))-methyltransferase RlmH [uncultured Ruthenibacterium sp.]|uniref:23S rRNA (pseudouridine(1915)-N(3))-methyltransferase RlmH n=1 Tax=uncultured Ruthenibacterium sp. TaxID=1905347 RepID=UPI00349EE82D